jgi:GcrA cell cycle regulator
MTANEIAGVLGDGVTRNAVIGKLHRLGLGGIDKDGAHSATAAVSSSISAASPGDDDSPSEKSVDSAVNGQTDAIVSKAPPTRPSVTIADLSEGMCRWPADDSPSGEFRYCGQPTAGTAPYCAGHSKLAYQPTKPVRRKPDRNSLFPGIVIVAPK